VSQALDPKSAPSQEAQSIDRVDKNAAKVLDAITLIAAAISERIGLPIPQLEKSIRYISANRYRSNHKAGYGKQHFENLVRNGHTVLCTLELLQDLRYTVQDLAHHKQGPFLEAEIVAALEKRRGETVDSSAAVEALRRMARNPEKWGIEQSSTKTSSYHLVGARDVTIETEDILEAVENLWSKVRIICDVVLEHIENPLSERDDLPIVKGNILLRDTRTILPENKQKFVDNLSKLLRIGFRAGDDGYAKDDVLQIMDEIQRLGQHDPEDHIEKIEWLSICNLASGKSTEST
jgi:hypothetical protein